MSVPPNRWVVVAVLVALAVGGIVVLLGWQRRKLAPAPLSAAERETLSHLLEQ